MALPAMMRRLLERYATDEPADPAADPVSAWIPHDGGFVAHVGPDQITCANVVVATGTFGRTPKVPDFADRLDSSIRQLHSTQYKRPDQLLPGATLVVGASHSGFDIAYEVAIDHPTVLAGRVAG